MGRKASDAPAVCPHCSASFDGLKDNRYWGLKRHMASCKKNDPMYSNCTVNNQCVIINVNVNGSVVPADVMKLVTDAVKNAIEQVLQTNDGYVAVKVFDALHCNPKHPETHVAVIPNVSKDQMLVVNKDGITEVKTKDAGARQILDSLFDNELPVVSREIDDDVLSGTIELEKVQRDTIIPELITHLEAIPKSERTRTANNLKKKVHVS